MRFFIPCVKRPLTALLLVCTLPWAPAQAQTRASATIPAYDALFHADQALQRDPHKPQQRRAYVLALQRAGLFAQAWRQAQTMLQHFSAAEQRALQADAAALTTRLAATPARSESERFVLADRALADYARMLSEWQTQGEDAAADRVRIRIDRLSALHARVRMAELVTEYEALAAAGAAIPAWALAHAASAYLYLRAPERARDVYRAALAALDAATPAAERAHLGPAAQRLELESGLFYALVEADQLDEAAALARRIEGYGPAWLYLHGEPRAQANTRYLDAQLLGASARMVADDTPAAQERLARMVAAAPNNTHVRTTLAGVLRARGQPRLAEIQLKLAETMTPRALGVENAQGEVALDLQEWRQAELLSADTLARAPEDQGTQRLARRWAVQQKPELRIEIGTGIATNNPVSGRGGVELDTVLYSAPLAYRWRGLVGAGWAHNRYAEGRARSHWQRAGVEWRSRDQWAEGEVSAQHHGHGTRTGLRLEAAHDIDDHWRVGAGVERLARTTPLRALSNGTTANAVRAQIRWRAHERRVWQLNVAGARFSDGNRRHELSLSGRERLLTRAHLNLDLRLEFSTQGNSQDADHPYYNPKRDFTLLPGLTATHTLYQRYDSVWRHDLTLAAGTYQQRGYGSGAVLGLSYGHTWRAHDTLDLRAEIAGAARPYDGAREREWQFRLSLTTRF